MSAENLLHADDRQRDIVTIYSPHSSRGLAVGSIARMRESTLLTPKELEQAHLIHRESPARRATDSFREIRTRLLSLGGGENFVTLVVPVSAGSGASFVARNLAAAFALDESKTALLMDCNIRSPSQDKALRVDATSGGLIDYLEEPERNLQDAMYATGIRRLRLIPAGQPRESGAEYLSSFRMRALVVALRSRYSDRYIVIDGPALLGSPDARILSELADFVVIVAGYGRDTASSIDQASSAILHSLAFVDFHGSPFSKRSLQGKRDISAGSPRPARPL